MRQTANRITAPLFALLFAASITFGVNSVFAQVQAPCDYDPPTVLGYCATEEECDVNCWGHGGFDGTCTTSNCCICAI